MFNDIKGNEVMEADQVPDFIDDFNDEDHTTIIVDTKWWAYAIIVVGVVIAATFMSLIYLAIVRGVTSL